MQQFNLTTSESKKLAKLLNDNEKDNKNNVKLKYLFDQLVSDKMKDEEKRELIKNYK